MERWYKTDIWKAFLPNLLAIIAGIAVTFGTDRIIENYRHKQDVRDAITELKTDAYESLTIYRRASDHCRSTTSTVDSVMHTKGRYEVLPEETLRRFLGIILEQADFTFTTSTDDILKSSGILQYMEPELLAQLDDLRESEYKTNSAIRNVIADLHQIRTALRSDSRKYPHSMRGYSGGAEAVQFAMGCPTVYNFVVHSPFEDLADLIDREYIKMEKTLKQIEAMGY